MALTDRGISTCRSAEAYNGNSDAVRDIRWSPLESSLFATATDSGAVQLWDYRKANAPVLRVAAHDKPCFSVDWHPDGKHIVSGGSDKQVKTWDFSSSAERRQKPTFQFRTPQAILNVRWRPPSWTGSSQGSGDWQASQLVTSYDRDDPRVHLWDLRRPYIPFREFDRYDSCATDLLWHSKDLLWTVGDAGIFTQTDIRYATQVVRRRPTCSVAWSPSGEVLTFAQKRPEQPVGISAAEFLGFPEDEPSEKPRSQSPVDDPDETGSVSSARQNRQSSARQSKSLSSSPIRSEFFHVLALEKALSKNKLTAPRQLGTVGSIQGTTMDAAFFRYLARHYYPLMEVPSDENQSLTPLQSFLESFDNNAECADEASLFPLAQTWRIVKFSVVQELQSKARKRRQSADKGGSSLSKGLSKEKQLAERNRAVEEGRNDKVKSRLFRGVTDNEGRRSPHPDPESTSNMTTPTARPMPGSPKGNAAYHASLDDNVDIKPLPPSVLSSTHATVNSSEWTMSDMDGRSYTQSEHRPSQSSEDGLLSSGNFSFEQAGITRDPRVEQRTAPRAIAGREDWPGRDGSDIRPGAEDEYDQKMENKKAAIRDYKTKPKKILSLDSPVEMAKPVPLGHSRGRESQESFPMFSASTDSSGRGKSTGASYSPKHQTLDTVDDDSGEDEMGPENGSGAARGLTQVGDEPDSPSLEGSSPKNQIHLERPSSPPPLLKVSRPLATSRESDTPQHCPDKELVCQVLPGVTEDLSEITLPISLDASERKPWSVEVILKEAIRHYHSDSLVDIQTAAHLLHKLQTLYDDWERIVPYEESELIYQTYNEHLLRQSLYVEAAELHLACTPTYPSVYEYGQTDTFTNVFCFTCKRPYENPKPDNTRCDRCSTPQDACPICLSAEPPEEWLTATQTPNPQHPNPAEDTETHSITTTSETDSISAPSSTKTERIPPSEIARLDKAAARSPSTPRAHGTALWTWCQGCGHGGHVACLTTWLSDAGLSEGACATPGCFHDCAPGPRRDSHRAALVEASKRRDSAGSRKASSSASPGFAKRDPWAMGESRAVEKVRGMLSAGAGVGVGGIGGGGGGAVNAGSPSPGMVSPKKVRLVTPTEQGKRRGGSSRGSGGGGGEGSGNVLSS